MNRHHKALELDKILTLLGSETSCEEAQAQAVSLCPAASLAEANALLDETSDAHMLIARFGAPSFGGYKSLDGMLARADAGAVLSPSELLQIRGNTRIFRQISEWRAHSAGIETVLNPRFHMITPNKYLEDKIGGCILNEEEISDNASLELSAIRRKINAAHNKIRDQLDKLIRSSTHQKYLQDAIITQRNGRFVVPVKNEHRAEIKGLVHDTSASGATVFVEPMGVVEANNELRILRSKEADEIERILAELSADAASFKDSLLLSGQMLVELCVVFAKAKLAYQMKAARPILNDRGVIDLKKARHPLIDPKKVVPTDIMLGKDFDTLIITGPNTGGKTVSLKTMGLLSLMAMCGLMIPAAEQSALSVFNNILCDIGDEQSIEQSLSTFSSHMVNIIDILEIADPNTLVLMDELGAGTDPVEGAALAMSILESLHAKGAKISATTHYAELKAYALDTPHIENGCCEFDVASLKPTYRLLIGMPGRSNAFAISERLGMPPTVVDRARDLVSGDNRRFEDVVEKLEQTRQDMENEKSAALTQKQEADRIAADAARKLDETQKNKERVLQEAKEEARRLVQEARRQYDLFLSQMDDLKKQAKQNASPNKAGLAAKLGQLENTADPLKPSQNNEHYVLPRPLVAGDDVLIVDLDKKAVVLKAPDGKDMVEVQAGIIKTRVPLKNLRLLAAQSKAPERTTTRNVANKVARDASTEIDLRGQMTDEAIMETDRFIDNCVLSGLSQITIIHGKGTGALRKAIQSHLRNHPSVKGFRLGVFGEGEAGVTVVELK